MPFLNGTLSWEEAEAARQRGERLQYRDLTHAPQRGWVDSEGGEINEYMSDFDWRVKPAGDAGLGTTINDWKTVRDVMQAAYGLSDAFDRALDSLAEGKAEVSQKISTSGLAILMADSEAKREARVRKILGTWIKSDNSLSENDMGSRLLEWPAREHGKEQALLAYFFTADELEAIAWWMRNKAKP